MTLPTYDHRHLPVLNKGLSHRPWFGALVYLAFGVFWISSSDFLLGAIVTDPELYSQYQTYKGWMYVAFTALLAWVLLWQRTRAEKESNQIRSLFSLTFELANVGIAHVSKDGQWLRCNARLCQMFGYSEIEMQQMTFQDITHPDDLNKDLTQMEQLGNGIRREYNMEKRYRHKEGHYIWTRLYVRAVDASQFGELFFISIIEDIQSIKETETALRETNMKFSALLDSGADISVQGYEADGTTFYWNKASERIYGYRADEAIGRNLLDLIIPEPMHAVVTSGVKAMVESGQPIPSAELVLKRKNQQPVTVFSSHTLIDLPGKKPQFFCIDIDLTEQKKQEQRVAYLADFDALTDLPNRQSFVKRLSQVLERSSRRPQLVAVIVLDVDHFKNINDSYGHAIGDELLQQVSQALGRLLRPSDYLARLGGDEFAALIEGIEQPEDAARVADKLLNCIHRVWTLSNGVDVKLSASAGISLFPLHEQTADSLLQGADSALYKAKSEGRNTSAYYSDGMTQSARERLTLESRLRNAIVEQQLSLHYQPQIDLSSGRIVGAEALLRWYDPDEGFIAPSRFIPIAESSGLIHEIGLWVIEQSCRQGVLWLQEGLPPLIIAVNVSAHQFQRNELQQQIADTLLSSGFPAEQLELEMTESALMTQHERAVGMLSSLKALGIRLAIDDFGTGYSSLAYLKSFPIDVLKIDKSFIDQLPEHQQDAEICKAIVTLAHTLGFDVLAEGVELAAQQLYLQQIGCDCYQGYYYSKPLPASEFSELLKRVGLSD
ncbi:EAL domain-containing protein [Alkalimonas collagenimarina]|uniref:EAL domain-containing protein n=1 Tax=Alkalimonas collagenimarina TaxID=400390 RepID=A0ABT9GY69_9GAMM|nr:EAL domain-containing protein [Alkalimonas collagenimarina]MDP4535996.1 EAL domain-containing protein [Alkalimonas collagenimarina]